mgnify:CR=1 FL=1|jgi:ATP-dependent protease ClpP protease subunit
MSEIMKESNVVRNPVPIGFIFNIYLSGDIKSSEEYLDAFEVIRNAQQNDIVYIHINSHGGDVSTTIQFIRCMGDSKAHIVCSVEGYCMSAATMIFLCGNSFEISDHSVFMFHDYSGGTFGKGGEMYDQITHERKWTEGILQDIYQNFLNKEELESLIGGKDIWMTAKEVSSRLQKLNKLEEEKDKRKSKAKKTK